MDSTQLILYFGMFVSLANNNSINSFLPQYAHVSQPQRRGAVFIRASTQDCVSFPSPPSSHIHTLPPEPLGIASIQS